MSEKSMETCLEEKVLQARNGERRGLSIAILGSILAVFSFFFPLIIKLMYGSGALVFFVLVGLFGGVTIVIVGLAISIYYAVERGALLRLQSKCRNAPTQIV